MKKIVWLSLMLLLGCGVCFAQNRSGKKVSTVVFATDIECQGCVDKIMNNVPSLGRGVKDVQPDIETRELTIVFDASKNSVEHLAERLAALRVQAELKSLDGVPADQLEETKAEEQK